MGARTIVALAAAGIIGLLGLFGVFGSYYTIGAGEAGVLTNMGAVTGSAQPGFHFKAPFVTGVETIDTRVQVIEWCGDSAMHSYSSDQQPAVICLKVSYHALPDEKSVMDLYNRFKTLDALVNSTLSPRTYQAVKTIFGQYDAVSAIQKRAAFDTDVDSAIRTSLLGFPIGIDGVQVENIGFSKAYEDAVETRMQAQVNVERQEQTKKTEQINADIAVIQAKGAADARVAAATAEAQAITLRGNAEATAITARNKAIADSPKLVDLTLAEKWDGKLPTTVPPGATIPFLPMGK